MGEEETITAEGRKELKGQKGHRSPAPQEVHVVDVNLLEILKIDTPYNLLRKMTLEHFNHSKYTGHTLMCFLVFLFLLNHWFIAEGE